MPEPGKRIDPARNFNFLVELDGITRASFIECSGLDATTEVIETREGGENTTVSKIPGKTTYSDITLKWGITDSDELWLWRQQIIDGNVQRKSGSIVIFDLRLLGVASRQRAGGCALGFFRCLADEVGRTLAQRDGP